MRTITIQATPALERIMTEWLAHLVLAIPTGPDGGALIFDGNLNTGTVVAQRFEGKWSVSFRPNPDGTRIRHYANPAVVARVIIAREHDDDALDVPVDAKWALGERYLDGDLACTGHEPEGASNA